MLPKNHSSIDYSWLVDILFLISVLTLFYFLWLGSYPLFTPDEGRYSEVAREMIASRDYVTPRVNGVAFLDKPVLYYWLQAVAIHLFGLKEWALRFFPALMGIMGCLVTYLCGRRLFDRRTGWLSAIILAATPLYFGGAHYADLNLEVAVFISCTLLFFITAIQSEDQFRPYFLFAAYLFAAFAFLTKGLIGIAFPCIIAGSWIILLWRWDILKKIHLIAGILFFIVLVSPWYILVQKANPEFLHYFFVTQQVSRFLSTSEFNNPTPFWFYLPIILLGAFPWTVFLIQALARHAKNIWQTRQQYQAELFLLLWFVIILAFFSVPRSKTVGYILPVFPALALLVGSYLSSIWETIKQKSIRWHFANLTIFSGLFALFFFSELYFNWVALPAPMAPYLTIAAVTFLLTSLVSLIIPKQKLLFLFLTCTACAVIFLLTVVASANSINLNTTKPLAVYLKTIMKPQDEVANYFKFYQDLPIYLEKRITIVADWNAPDIASKDNWRRELWFSMPFQKTDDWLINEEKFWQRWHRNQRMFVFVNKNYFNQFKSHTKQYVYLADYKDIILLSNQAENSALHKLSNDASP